MFCNLYRQFHEYLITDLRVKLYGIFYSYLYLSNVKENAKKTYISRVKSYKHTCILTHFQISLSIVCYYIFIVVCILQGVLQYITSRAYTRPKNRDVIIKYHANFKIILIMQNLLAVY